MSVERTQKDAKDLAGNDLTLIFEKYEEGMAPADVDARGIFSCVVYNVGPNRFEMIFATAKNASDAYNTLKNVRSFGITVNQPEVNQPQVKITEEERQ